MKDLLLKRIYSLLETKKELETKYDKLSDMGVDTYIFSKRIEEIREEIKILRRFYNEIEEAEKD